MEENNVGTEEKPGFDATVEDVGPCKKKMSIKIPGDRVTEEIDKQYADVIESYTFKGFRRGKTPRRLVERQLGDQILSEVRQNLVVDTFEKALEERELQPLGEPDVDIDDLVVEAGKGVEFDVTFEIRPEFDLPDLGGVEVDREVPAVSEEDITNTLDGLARRSGKYEPCEDPGEIRPDDVVGGPVALEQNGETVLSHDEFSFVPGEKRLYGLPVPGLPEAIAKAELGKPLKMTIHVPEFLAGGGELTAGDATVRIQPETIRRIEPAEVNDEFAKKLDFDSLDALKEDIRKQGERDAERHADREVEEKILDELIGRVQFDVPEGLIDRQVEASAERSRLRMQMEGIPNLEIEEKLDLERNAQRDDIERSVRKAFLLEKIAAKEKIFVTEDAVEATVQVLARQQGRDPDELRHELQQRGQIRELRVELRERMTREALRKKAKITDKGNTDKGSSDKKIEAKD